MYSRTRPRDTAAAEESGHARFGKSRLDGDDDRDAEREALGETIDAIGATVAVALAACGPQASLEVVRLLGDIGRSYSADSVTGKALRLVCRRVVAQLGLGGARNSDEARRKAGPESMTSH